MELTDAQEARVTELQNTLDIAVEEAVADNPDISPDDAYHDMLSSVLWDEPDNSVALELCRVTMGSVPFDLEHRLGRVDFLE